MTEPGMPRPSIWPVALALGVSIACAGVITHWIILVGGALLTILALGGWVADTVRGG
ncbi:MAG TPA: cytochrome c oxidase subunit 4 [Candidatus Limnocylindria bacterium]|nr:cytochrome c oxidase subunit 4 [Candidatus Limnocylindria bacterium]